MPTKKRRVGFIPRSDVLDLINKLSYESNLSCSKIINILVEEALYKRGMYEIRDREVLFNSSQLLGDDLVREKEGNINKELNDDYKYEPLKKKNHNSKEVKEEILDNEIYAKFLMFLKFQERMKMDDL